ncbi:MAG: cation:proton antiporter [Caldisericaceae bacterium]|nr:cation:proton antiporter [Caldisericaceae bacterium]
MDVFVYTFLLLASALFFGHIATKLKQPQIVGEIIGGIVVGPLMLLILPKIFVPEGHAILRFFSHEEASDLMKAIIDFSGVFLMLGAGLEINLSDLVHAGKSATLTAIFGVVTPFALGYVASTHILHLSFAASLYIATSVSITAVALSVATLIQIGKLNTKAGITIVGAAVVDDIIGIILLSVLTSISATGKVPNASALIKVFIVPMVFVGVSIWLGPIIGRFVFSKAERLSVNERLSIILLWVFVFSMLAHMSGLHVIIGAFIGGLTVRPFLRKAESDAIERWIWGFFAPLFFAWTGFAVVFSKEAFGMPLLVIVTVAFVGKIFGGGLGAFISGIPIKQSFVVGIGMNGRAAVELIVANIALTQGIINRDIYSSIVFMAMITALATPIMLKEFGTRFLPEPETGD